jgi:hypothetical protein
MSQYNLLFLIFLLFIYFFILMTSSLFSKYGVCKLIKLPISGRNYINWLLYNDNNSKLIKLPISAGNVVNLS